ncbi:MAG TPA: energy transducer TonB, partial [Chitinophagaceae bacterium]|nr:energy transducer TonB [Chitinophagaceae bacterium]
MIETNKILQTDLLDILFDGRNKQYGAYELRKQYSKRMIIAVIVMIICCLLFFLLYAFASGKNVSRDLPILDSVRLVELKHEEKKPEPIPPQPKTIQPQIKTIKLATPRLTNEEIKPEDEMPDKEVLEVTKIGKFNQDGVDTPDIVAPPVSDDGKGVTEIPKKREDDDEIVLIVQIESEYPGGIESWRRYLGKNLRYPP